MTQDSVRDVVPAGTRVRIGGFEVELRSDVPYNTLPIYAPFVKAAIQQQHARPDRAEK